MKPLRVLLVDDDPDDRVLVARALEREIPALDVEQVSDARSFDLALEDGRFDLVITDYQLRWSDGIRVLRAVKSRFIDCPVIMFTATGGEAIAVEAMKAGLDDYVIKSPKHYVRLPGAVQIVLEKTRQRIALREAENRFRTLFDGVPVGLYRLTMHGQILDANPALVDMLGYPNRTALQSISIQQLYVRPREYALWQERMLKESVVRGVEVELRRHDGGTIWVMNDARIVLDREGRIRCYEGVLRDITAHKHAELERAARERRQRRHQDALLQLVTAEHGAGRRLGASVRAITETAVRTLPVDRASVWQLGRRARSLKCVDAFDEDHGHRRGGALRRDELPHLFEALDGNLVFTVSAGEDHATTRAIREQFMQARGAHTILVAPVRQGGVTLGLLLLEHEQPREWALDEQSFAVSLADLLALAFDADRRRRAEAELFRERELAQVTLRAIGDGVITTSAAGVIEYLNPVAEQLTGWRYHEARGQPVHTVLRLVSEATRQAVPDPVQRCVRAGATQRITEHMLLQHRSEDREFAIEITVSPIRGADQKINGCVLVLHDVTELRGLVKQMAYQATHDPLTGLINRREFEARLEQALDLARRGGREHALCYLDLDQFKVINDTCGHAAGDELLRQLAEPLLARVRETDTLARLGGDEFGVLLENCPLENARRVANQLRKAIQEFRFEWGGRTFEIGASIGLVPIGPDSGGLSDLLSAADSACYVAKERGRNRVHVSKKGDWAMAQRHGQMEWVQRIRDALKNGGFHLWVQPYTSLHNGARERHGELLLRMADDKKEWILPRDFLAAAERYHLMPEIDRWVVQAALAALEEEGSPLDAFGICSLNLSGQSIGDDHFLDFVLDQLEHHRIEPGRLCFEITETAAVANMNHALDLIATLRERGCHFALDDFGTGMSSFAYLKNLPVDFLKIDGTFVREMTEDAMNYAMVESINQLGHVLGMRTVAEFAETEAVVEALKQVGVDYAQGHAIAPPVPLGPA